MRTTTLGVLTAHLNDESSYLTQVTVLWQQCLLADLDPQLDRLCCPTDKYAYLNLLKSSLVGQKMTTYLIQCTLKLHV